MGLVFFIVAVGVIVVGLCAAAETRDEIRHPVPPGDEGPSPLRPLILLWLLGFFDAGNGHD